MTTTATTTPSAGAVVVDTRTAAERFAANASAKLGMASTWVMLIGAPALSLLSALWPADQAAQGTLMQSLGIGGAWRAILPLFVTWALNTFNPPKQGAVPPALADTMVELAMRKLNAELVAHGRPPLPVPEASVTARTNVLLLPAPPAAAAPVAAPAAPVAPPFVDTQPQVDIPAEPPATAAAVISHLAAVTQPADKMAAVRPLFPGLTDDQIRAELAGPKPQPAIVIPPFLQPQPAPGT